MTDWRRTFRAELFRAWQREGLPAPHDFERYYDEVRESVAPPDVPLSEAVGPLDADTVRSVHGFGAVMGTVLADLLDVPQPKRSTGVSWCARFNLGISLIDWLCDEGGIRAEDVARLPALATLSPRPLAASAPIRDPVVRYLDALAGDLLAELALDAGPPRPNEPRSSLWPSLRGLLRAELRTIEPDFFDPTSARDALPTLRLKSVEPFRIMGERVVLTERVARGRTTMPVSAARRIGRAIGECVWLTDDADDIWRDLDAGCGNRFIAEAATIDPMVVSADGSAFVDVALLRVLKRERLAERLAAMAVRRLAAAASDLPEAPQRATAMGLLGVSLARWTG